jgi:hypothetical protein
MQLPDTLTASNQYRNKYSPGHQVKTGLLEFTAGKAKPFVSYNDTITVHYIYFLYQLILTTTGTT